MESLLFIYVVGIVPAAAASMILYQENYIEEVEDGWACAIFWPISILIILLSLIKRITKIFWRAV